MAPMRIDPSRPGARLPSGLQVAGRTAEETDMARATRGPARAGVGALLLLVVSSVLAVGAAVPASVAAPLPAAASVADLRAEVARTSARLAAATERWQRGQVRLGVQVQRQVAAERALEALRTETVDARAQVAGLANALYRNPVSPVVAASFAGDQRLMTDALYLRDRLNLDADSFRASTDLLATREATAERLLAQQQAAALTVTRMQTSLDAELTALQRDAAASAARLASLLAELRAREEARLLSAGGGATCASDVPPLAVNGFLPISALCPLRTAPGHRLVRRAAQAFDAMAASFAADNGGTRLCVTDSYRDYASQVDVFRRKPNLAATPGRSQHGWGLAVDLCGGIQQFGSSAHQWMQTRAREFGFVHPDWAEPDGSRPEPWHWEFVG